ncbi:MAG: hypothetical protein NXY59_02415 [Aigarchaeota archaeon]|nr:hypothetical protein [Candidatus Pelearchaeum maunauluense]
MEKLFPTMEVGSLSKAPFITRDKKRAIREAKEWGERLQVENWASLIEALNTENSLTPKELQDWASLYGIRFLESAGLDVIYDGEQRRKEMYEYPVNFIEGFEFRGIVKVWDSEFYRKAAVIARPRLREPYHLDEFLFVKKHARRAVKIPITGAYTLADWSFDEYYVRNIGYSNDPRRAKRDAKHEFVLELARGVIRPNIQKLIEAGAEYIQLDEPAAAAKPDEADIFVESFNESIKGLDAVFVVHICYTNYAWLFPHLLDLRAEIVSISCSNADTRELGVADTKRPGFRVLSIFREQGAEFKVAPGVVDVHTDFIEPPELVRDRLLYSAKVLGDDEKVVACNDCGLRTRRWEVAYEKQLSLTRGAALARKTM